jgi:hypothetical protein
VIESCLTAGRIQVEPDITIADSDSATVGSARALHSEHIAEKISFVFDIAADDRQMSHLCKHGGLL